MKFENAYKEMLEGKKIRRKSWDKFQHIKYVPATDKQDATVRTYKCEFNNFFGQPSMLISDGWLVVDGDGKELTFIEALEQLKNKKELTNKVWVKGGKDYYIFVDGNKFASCSAVESDFMPTYACLTSSDWEIM